MTEPVDPKSRRDVITKLVPYVALSAIKVGAFASPLSLLTSAAARYNENTQTTEEKVNDLLALLPGIEKLKIETVGPGKVSLQLQRQDIRSYVEQYLVRVFSREGAVGTTALSAPAQGEAQFDCVLRLPSRAIYAKVIHTLTSQEESQLLSLGRKLNPAELWIFADSGPKIDVRLDPVFMAENRLRRGRIVSVSTAEMLSELFGHRFAVTVESSSVDDVKVTLRSV